MEISREPKIAFVETTDSPAGPLTFAVNGSGAMLRLKFLDGKYERTVEEELLREGFLIAHEQNLTAQARGQIQEYCAGTRRTFDVPIVWGGTQWQNTVWQALTRIPYGQTCTYGQVAAMIGRPGTARAVGRANAMNRLPLIIPCHRVIGGSGSLTGFAGGLHLKTLLLAHEEDSLFSAPA